MTWPTDEPARSAQGFPAASVAEKYNELFNWLEKKVPEKEVNWKKIYRTTQEPKETVHFYFERLMQGFTKYSVVGDGSSCE